jgi:hypothetical protein
MLELQASSFVKKLRSPRKKKKKPAPEPLGEIKDAAARPVRKIRIAKE